MHDISCMFWFQKFLQLKLWCGSLDALFVLLADGFIFNALFSRWFDMVDVLYTYLMWGDDFHWSETSCTKKKNVSPLEKHLLR